MTQEQQPLEVPGRSVPVPAHLSPEAQGVLGMGRLPDDGYPPLDDLDAWRRTSRERDEMMLPMLQARAAGVAASVDEREVRGVPLFVVDPDGASPDDPRVFLEIHGGGLVMGAGACCRAMAIASLERSGARTWAPDYRMPPDAPYPAAVDDCLAVYQELLEGHRPEDIIIGGASAGGNIAAAVILRARDEGLPLPAAVVLLTPELDLTESGDSFHANAGLDTVLPSSLMPANLLYAGDHPLTDPYVSPLFGDLSKGFPPTFLSSGTRDLFLSNAVRMHRALRAAGIQAELHLLEAAPHGGFFGSPEDAQLDREVRRFVDAHWGVPAPAAEQLAPQ